MSFGQNKIYFEGTYVDEYMYDGMQCLEIKVTTCGSPALRGRECWFYITYSDIDDKVIDCNNKLLGYKHKDIAGKKVRGYVIRSSAKYEDMEFGGVKTKKGIYRLSEISLVK